MLNKIEKSKNNILTFSAMCSLAIILSACDNDNNSTNNTTIGSEDIQGTWEQTGYGKLLRIEGKTADTFDFTRNTCIKTSELDSEELDQVINKVALTSDKKSFSRTPPGAAFTEIHNKLDALPDSCHAGRIIEASTPILVFDHLWNTFNDYYAFFAERNVDWEQQRADYRPKVTDDMSDEALFTLLSEMLDPLDDDHVVLSAETDTFEENFSPAHETFIFENEIAAEFYQQTQYDDLGEYMGAKLSEARQHPLQFVDNVKQAGPISDGFPAVYWGTIGDIAYINFTRMIGFDETLKEGDDDSVYDQGRDMQAVDAIIKRVIADLKDTQAMVIDVRLNYGGHDLASLKIANHFTTQQQRVISQFTRSFAGETPQVHASLEPVAEPYTKPVTILASQDTGSAAEIFLMAMNSLPNITLVGEASNGRLSATLDKVLPNEWEFSLSNEVFIDSLDRRLEASGVPVDIHVKPLSIADLNNSTDTALETALNSLRATLSQ